MKYIYQPKIPKPVLHRTEMAGIEIEGNKWETLMKTSLSYQTYTSNKQKY